MFINLYSRKFTVYLASTSADMEDARQELAEVLDNAGIAIVDAEGGLTSGGTTLASTIL